MKFNAHILRDGKWIHAGEWESKNEEAVREAVMVEWEVDRDHVSVEEIPKNDPNEPAFWCMTSDGPKSSNQLYGTRHGREHSAED